MHRNAYGLDISDRSAELVSLFQKRGSVAIGGFGRTEIPPGIINRGVILDPDKLVIVLTRFFDAVFGPKRGRLPVGFALPEALVYSKTFPLPLNFDRDLAMKALTIEASDTFPISVNETVHDIWVVSRTKETQEVMYAAAGRHGAEAYRDVLIRAGSQPLFFDGESMALSRVLADPVDNQPVLIVDIGAKTTMLVLYDAKSVQMSSNIATGGDNLSAALEVQLNIPLEKAEVLKRKAGFDPSAEDGRAFLILQRPMGEIIEEINLTSQFYFRKTGRRVHKIVLAGGTSLTPSVVEYIESSFQGVEVMIGKPLRGISLEWLSDPEAFSKKSIIYATAIGLALRALGQEAGPGINLLPGAREKRGGASAFFGRLSSIGSLFSSMTARPKKPAKKKGSNAEEAEVAAEAAVPADLPAEAAAPPVAEPPATPTSVPEAPAAPAASSGDILAGLNLGAEELAKPAAPAEPAPSAPKAASKESSEMLDFGRGIGDFLGSTYEGKEATAEELAEDEIEMPRKGGERIKIEHILKRAKGELPEDENEEIGGAPVAGQRGGNRLLVVGLAVLVILLVLAAAGGVFMFAKKNGFPKITWPFGNKGEQAAVNGSDNANQPPAGTAVAPDSVSTVFTAALNSQPAGDKPLVIARVLETDVSASDTFKATGTTTTAAGKAKGFITIINTTSRSYTFVATTRFLSPDNILFRMDHDTNIPANGQVTTAVTADQPGPSGDVGPTKWTIPGLPQGLQDDIYGKSDAAMTGGSGTAASITQSDLDLAKAALTAKLSAEGGKNFDVMMAPGEKLLPELITSSELKVEAPAAGTVASSFTMKVTLRFRAMVIPEPAVVSLLEAKLSSALPEGGSAADYELGAPQYTVEAYDTDIEQAQIRAEATVKKL